MLGSAGARADPSAQPQRGPATGGAWVPQLWSSRSQMPNGFPWEKKGKKRTAGQLGDGTNVLACTVCWKDVSWKGPNPYSRPYIGQPSHIFVKTTYPATSSQKEAHFSLARVFTIQKEKYRHMGTLTFLQLEKENHTGKPTISRTPPCRHLAAGSRPQHPPATRPDTQPAQPPDTGPQPRSRRSAAPPRSRKAPEPPGAPANQTRNEA